VQPEGKKASQLARFNEGIAAQAGGDWETAARLFQDVVALDPSIVEGWNNLGNALLRLGKLPDADRALRRALSLDPNYPAALVNAGLLRLQDGRPAEGLFRARRLARPRNPAPRVNLAISQARQGALSEAEEILAAARRAFPGNADVLYHLGTLYERAGNRDKAREAYGAFLSASAGLQPDRERLVRERLLEWKR
jgi:Flp pilus assembly protein TadD